MINHYFIKNKNLIIIIVLLALVSFIYYKLFDIFYQQDEWVSLGWSLLVKKPIDLFQDLNLWQVILGKGRFVPFAIGFLFFKYFPFNIAPFAIYSLFFHAINTIITYYIAKKYIKNNTFSFLAAIFFAVNSVSSSAVAWYGTSLGTLPSVTFILLSVFSFTNYLEKERSRDIIITFIYLYISLFFKEIGMHLFILYPVVAFFYKKQNVFIFIKKYWIFAFFFLLSAIYRIYDIRYGIQNQVNTFLTGDVYFWQTLFLRCVMYPLTSFSLILVHPIPFLELSRFITRLYYPFVSAQEFSLIAQTNVSDLLSVIFSFVLFGAIFIVSRLFSRNDNKRIIFWILFILTSYIPYVIVSKNFTYLESRYYYLAASGMGILICLILFNICKIYKSIFIKVGLIIFVLLFCFWQIFYLDKDLSDQVKISKERISFLNQLLTFKSKLNLGKTVFYITSDTDYYIVGNKIPFQQGSGYTLMLWYDKDRTLPEELFKKEFLYRLGTQGYMGDSSSGFGYYSDINVLKNDLKDNKFKMSDVVPLKYDSANKILLPYKIQ